MPKSRKMRQSRKKGGFGEFITDRLGLTTSKQDQPPMAQPPMAQPPMTQPPMTQPMPMSPVQGDSPSVMSRFTSLFSRTPEAPRPGPVGGKRRQSRRRSRSSRLRKRR